MAKHNRVLSSDLDTGEASATEEVVRAPSAPLTRVQQQKGILGNSQ